MKPVMQSLFKGPQAPPEERGDCFRACIASILELDLTDLPNPHDAPHWYEAWEEALRPFGVGPFEIRLGGWAPPGYWIAEFPRPELGTLSDGVTPAGHCVVMHGETMVHDPAGRNEPLELSDIRLATLLLPLDGPVPTTVVSERDSLRFAAEHAQADRDAVQVNNRLLAKQLAAMTAERDKLAEAELAIQERLREVYDQRSQLSQELTEMQAICRHLLAAYDEEESEHGFPFNFALRQRHRELRAALSGTAHRLPSTSPAAPTAEHADGPASFSHPQQEDGNDG